jgi:hypothetical protein
MQQAGMGKRYQLGSYGAGTLWCVSNQSGLSMLFNDVPIARRAPAKTGARDWTSLNAAWKVTPVGGSEVWVQHNNGDGVFVTLSGGMR